MKKHYNGYELKIGKDEIVPKKFPNIVTKTGRIWVTNYFNEELVEIETPFGFIGAYIIVSPIVTVQSIKKPRQEFDAQIIHYQAIDANADTKKIMRWLANKTLYLELKERFSYRLYYRHWFKRYATEVFSLI